MVAVVQVTISETRRHLNPDKTLVHAVFLVHVMSTVVLSTSSITIENLASAAWSAIACFLVA